MKSKASGRKFTDEQVAQIRREFKEGVWENQLVASFHYDVSQSRISDIVTRKTYRWVEDR